MGLCVIKSSKKDFLQAKHPSKSVCFYKSNSLRNLICCKTCLFEIWLVQTYGFEICWVVKNGSKSDAFESFDSKHDALYKKWFKNRFFSKILIPFFFEWRKIFPQQLFQECKKSQHWRPYGVFWPAKSFFESQFSKKFRFSNNNFFQRRLMRCKHLDSSSDAMWNSIQTLTRKFLFCLKVSGVVKKVVKISGQYLTCGKKGCFKIWHAVKSPFPKMTS